ncbi:3-phosphoserine/phosphohydroxythreonine transaminase [Mariniblastus fucicola]|uniref:Phosphoserine aminotransferase n=1 Tax=Mariniblastus fucicola TaxID=980251 RepID=A0A5B9PE84_9BACT|nr:3-phosphoserine/phosphohydroxythreonine transaminase [Mariniblastus fucicola]QEG23809.1 Phosphoserine aminotransferase [Mariniblastus fucicola]
MTTTVSRVYNFSAGPAVLPVPVLEQIRDEMLSLPGVGSSVLEISHRSKDFDKVIEDADARIRRVMNIPDDYEVLFLQGGGALQNVMIPANLITDSSQTADYIQTGSWGKKSAGEVRHYGNLNVAFDAADSNYNRIPQQSELSLTSDAAYVHLTSNETIQGVQFAQLPETGDVPIVADMSSDILCRPVDVSKYGLFYACAQKNAGVAGVTVVVVRKDLVERSGDLPSYLSYAKHSAGGSRFNTPPSFGIYVTGLVCKWLEEEIGGLEAMEKQNVAKSKMIYDIIDSSEGFYTGHAADVADRSIMNVVFKLPTPEQDADFVAKAADAGMTTLKGHRSVGGIRASLYNAMPVEGVEALASFMKDYAAKA